MGGVLQSVAVESVVVSLKKMTPTPQALAANRLSDRQGVLRAIPQFMTKCWQAQSHVVLMQITKIEVTYEVLSVSYPGGIFLVHIFPHPLSAPISTMFPGLEHFTTTYSHILATS